jgi:hypothetical protein
MRCEFTVRIDTESRRSIVSNWIGRLKSSDEENERKTQLQKELRLHRARVISAKSPAFWERLMDCLQSDSDEMRKAFSSDNSRQCSFTAQGTSCILRSHAHPSVTFNLKLNVEGQTLDADWVSAGRIEQHFPDSGKSPKEFRLEVDESERIFVSLNEYIFTDPAHLAEHLVKRVCGIKDWI